MLGFSFFFLNISYIFLLLCVSNNGYCLLDSVNNTLYRVWIVSSLFKMVIYCSVRFFWFYHSGFYSLLEQVLFGFEHSPVMRLLFSGVIFTSKLWPSGVSTECPIYSVRSIHSSLTRSLMFPRTASSITFQLSVPQEKVPSVTPRTCVSQHSAKDLQGIPT